MDRGRFLPECGPVPKSGSIARVRHTDKTDVRDQLKFEVDLDLFSCGPSVQTKGAWWVAVLKRVFPLPPFPPLHIFQLVLCGEVAENGAAFRVFHEGA